MNARSTTPADLRALLAAARRAARKAHAPYSGFHVGAALRTKRGAVFAGCNVENASYGLTMCAERNAIATAVAAEGPKMRVTAIAIVVDALQAFPPCGACRQVIAEFADADAVVVWQPKRGAIERATIAELLPHGFKL
jgi:cytidine deaminase